MKLHCYVCKKWGHTKVNCPHKKCAYGEVELVVVWWEEENMKLHRYVSKKWGHTKVDCPHKRRMKQVPTPSTSAVSAATTICAIRDARDTPCVGTRRSARSCLAGATSAARRGARRKRTAYTSVTCAICDTPPPPVYSAHRHHHQHHCCARRCNFCGKEGHTKEDCPKLDEKIAQQFDEEKKNKRSKQAVTCCVVISTPTWHLPTNTSQSTLLHPHLTTQLGHSHEKITQQQLDEEKKNKRSKHAATCCVLLPRNNTFHA